MSMEAVTLSLVMPFYNKGEMVVEMIDSILANDYPSWELLAVDDGSSPETLTRIRPYAARDERIRLIHRERQPKGAPTCRNIGMEQARGEFIIFFDSDDYITPSCLATRVNALRQHPELDFMVFPSAQFINNQLSDSPERVYGYPIYADDIAAFARKTLPFVVVNNIYRTASLRKRGILWDTNLLSLQDSDFNMQCLLAQLKYDYSMTTPDYGYRIASNEGSISKHIASDQHLKSHLYALSKCYQSVREKYGNRYNLDLYMGVLFIYNMVFPEAVNRDVARQMAAIIRRYDRFRGCLFKLKIDCTRFLSLFLPARLARALPMMPYLLWRRVHEKKTIRQCQSFMSQTPPPLLT